MKSGSDRTSSIRPKQFERPVLGDFVNVRLWPISDRRAKVVTDPKADFQASEKGVRPFSECGHAPCEGASSIDHPVATLDTAKVVTTRVWQTAFAARCVNHTCFIRIRRIDGHCC